MYPTQSMALALLISVTFTPLCAIFNFGTSNNQNQEPILTPREMELKKQNDPAEKAAKFEEAKLKQLHAITGADIATPIITGVTSGLVLSYAAIQCINGGLADWGAAADCGAAFILGLGISDAKTMLFKYLHSSQEKLCVTQDIDQATTFIVAAGSYFAANLARISLKDDRD